MKLRTARKWEHKGKVYKRYFIDLPLKLIHALGWNPGDELEAKHQASKLTIEKK